MERLRSLKHKVSVRRMRRRSGSPSSTTSSLASDSRSSSKADLSTSATSSPARGGITSLSSSWTAAEAPLSSSQEAATLGHASEQKEVPHGAEGQAGIPPDPAPLADPATDTARDANPVNHSTSPTNGDTDSATNIVQDPTLTSSDILAITSKDIPAAKSSDTSATLPAAATVTAVDSPASDPLLDLRQRRTAKSASVDSSPIGKGAKPSASGGSSKMTMQRSWVILAAVSGCFAALNGTFAKLTTADRTDSLASFVAAHTGVDEHFLNVVFRGGFFLLNLVSNAIMWALFTRALTAHTSTTQVSLINTSANFLLTAAIGFAIFSEALPPAWFGGAALLVVGTVIIGRDRKSDETSAEASGVTGEEEGTVRAPAEDGKTAAVQVTEVTPLLAGDEVDNVAADGEHGE